MSSTPFIGCCIILSYVLHFSPIKGNTSESALGFLFWGTAPTGISAFSGKRKLLSLVSPEVELFSKLTSGFRSSLSILAAVSLTASSVVSIGTISALSEWTFSASRWPSSSASPSKSVPSSLQFRPLTGVSFFLRDYKSQNILNRDPLLQAIRTIEIGIFFLTAKAIFATNFWCWTSLIAENEVYLDILQIHGQHNLVIKAVDSWEAYLEVFHLFQTLPKQREEISK